MGKGKPEGRGNRGGRGSGAARRQPRETDETGKLRLGAVKILTRWDKGGAFAETLIERYCQETGITGSDRGLLSGMVLAVLRNRSWIDRVITHLREGKLDPEVRLFLQVGIAQMLVMGVAEHAAINETVGEAPQRVRGLVNAILRSVQREKREIQTAVAGWPAAIRHSVPQWLVKRWEAAYGPATCERLLDWANRVPHVYLRRNLLVDFNLPLPAGLEPLVAGYPNALEGWYWASGGLPVAALDAGAFSVTDPATRHAIELLAPRPGERILDACAAPGGKSVAILNAAMGQVNLVATDLEEHRLPRLRQNLEPFAMKCASALEVLRADWTEAETAASIGQFDAVLLDVPCSNTGVMQRRVDVRWRLSEDEISRLASLQDSILGNAAKAVKPGGRLVYSTCSIDAEENRGVVDRFLEQNPGWRLVEERLTLPGTPIGVEGESGGQEFGTDGSYAALLAY